ncbi:MAG TPA: hemerythrin domain-containing protein [Candidatus Dormibacteraeota bacterium]|nr:hemerythrin domain-containing protein [Candidatus Dormibacteraeota bacterium]
MTRRHARSGIRAGAARLLAVATSGGAAALLLRAWRRRERLEGQDVVDLLLSRHRETEQLIEEYERSTAVPEVRRAALRELRRRLSIHEAVEEQLVHPLVRRQLPDGHRLAAQVLAEERQAKQLLAAIEDAEPGGDDREELVRRLVEGVREHAHTEETLLFPALRLHLGPRERMRLGAMVERAERLAPTHPHPHAPGSVGIPVVGVLDRARDRVRHGSPPR